jgi:hypothetical protein
MFILFEKKRFSKKILTHKMNEDPVFIIGHWRTGSTFLHQLMNLDPQLAAPTLFQTAQPKSFIVSKRYYYPLMKMALGRTRPFDGIKNGVDEPQEDEFALVRMNGFSPMLGLVFPKKNKFFLSPETSYLPVDAKEKQIWIEDVKSFYNKLSYVTGKRLVLKNPFHSFRIPTLLEMYPHAKFIHIYRNPEDVILSTQNMWNIVGRQNTLNRNWKKPEVTDLAPLLSSLLTQIEHDNKNIRPENFAEIRFEDLESNPIAVLKKTYSNLGLPFSEDFQKKLEDFLNSITSYQKNSYEKQHPQREYIKKELSRFYQKYQYE